MSNQNQLKVLSEQMQTLRIAMANERQLSKDHYKKFKAKQNEILQLADEMSMAV